MANVKTPQAGLIGAGAIVVHAWRRVRASYGPESPPLLDAAG